jgi:hypothetical protein
MSRNEHTYLFRQGVWSADGCYRDNEDREFPVRGETRILHGDGKWLLEGKMCLFGDEEKSFSNSYEIEPFGEGRQYTSWISFNPAIGNMAGRFAVIDDTILSEFRSADDRFSGAEALRQINNQTYRSRGALFDGGRLISSWAVTLAMISAVGG